MHLSAIRRIPCMHDCFVALPRNKEHTTQGMVKPSLGSQKQHTRDICSTSPSDTEGYHLPNLLLDPRVCIIAGEGSQGQGCPLESRLRVYVAGCPANDRGPPLAVALQAIIDRANAASPVLCRERCEADMLSIYERRLRTILGLVPAHL